MGVSTGSLPTRAPTKAKAEAAAAQARGLAGNGALGRDLGKPSRLELSPQASQCTGPWLGPRARTAGRVTGAHRSLAIDDVLRKQLLPAVVESDLLTALLQVSFFAEALAVQEAQEMMLHQVLQGMAAAEGRSINGGPLFSMEPERGLASKCCRSSLGSSPPVCTR